MEALFTTFGIDWRLLLIQGANFGILLFGLWYFLYGPLMRMLDTRREKIAQGVAEAERAHQQLAEIEHSRAAALAQAGKEADELVTQARASGAKKERELIEEGNVAAARIVAEAESQAAAAKAQAIAESREEVAKLVVLGMEKALKEKRV